VIAGDNDSWEKMMLYQCLWC